MKHENPLIASRRLYLACYDISSDKRLRKALKLIKSHAVGRQKSVYEVLLDDAEKQQLLDAMDDLIVPQVDRFLLLNLDPRSRVVTLGRAVPPLDDDFFYIG